MTLTVSQRGKLNKRLWKAGGDNFCFYCAEKLSRRQRTLDHLTPKSRGGTAALSNMVLACRSCNNAKSDMTLVEFNHFVMHNGGIHAVKEKYGHGSHSRKKDLHCYL